MNIKHRKIEVAAKTADALEAQAAARGMSVSEFLAALIAAEDFPSDAESMCASGRGPWAPEVLAEDARRFEAFERTREGVPGMRSGPGCRVGERPTNSLRPNPANCEDRRFAPSRGRSRAAARVSCRT
jgi:hypothetical protein